MSAAIKVLEPTKPKMEIKTEGGNAAGGGTSGGQNKQNVQKRRRGGGFQHRGGRGGGGGGGNFNRNQGHFHSNNDFDGPMNKKPKVQGPDGRVFDKLMAIQGPSGDLPPKQYEAKKFLANTRLYIGNISPDVTEADIKGMFGEYGEIDEVFINREKNFAFLKLDFRASAERARAELDQRPVKGRPLKVRFAPANVRVKVRNLSPMVSNELLELAFGVFGEVEKALVFVDEKGRSLGEGFVDFTRKNNAQFAHKFCTEKCFFLTSELRPVITELSEMYEVDEGLLEANLPRREFTKNQENSYYKARELGPRVAEPGTFESEFGEKWKTLTAEFKAKELELKEEMQKEFDKLQAQMELARYDYETDMLRQQLRQRELDQERHKMEWETRMQPMQRVPRNFIGGGGGGPGAFNGRMNESQPQANMDMPQDEDPSGEMGGNSMPLAPPPMPPQSLMSHLQGGDEGGQSGPTWEVGPFGFGQMGGNFGQSQFQQNEPQGQRFMGPVPRGPPRGGMGGPGRGVFRGPFRGRGGRR